MKKPFVRGDEKIEVGNNENRLVYYRHFGI